MFVVSKKFKMEMAHVLDSSYMKCCQRIHGHSVVVEVSVSSRELNEDGMIMDFKLLKEISENAFVNSMDHAFLVSVPTLDRMVDRHGISTVSDMYPGLREVPYNPTAENLANDIYNQLRHSMPLGVKLEEVRYWETESSCVSYWEED